MIGLHISIPKLLWKNGVQYIATVLWFYSVSLLDGMDEVNKKRSFVICSKKHAYILLCSEISPPPPFSLI